MNLARLAILTVAASALTALAPTQARASDIDIRCSNDSLDPTAAKARLEWARYCGLKQNVGSPIPVNPAKREDTGVPSSNGMGNLIEFYEDFDNINFWGAKTFTSVSVGYQVNNTHISKQYVHAVTSQLIDTQGFAKWSRTANKALARPMYPTFGTNPNPALGAPLYPNPNNSTDCTLYTTKNATGASATFYVNGYCTSSCYTPEQEVLFPRGRKAIVDAISTLDPEVMTLTADSTLDNLSLKPTKVASYTKELWDNEHVIFEIRMASGGLLRVTDEHPVIQDDGRVVQAKRLKVGTKLVQSSGLLDPIVSIRQVSHFGKVYNLKPATTNKVSNILVAQGYLVGSSAYQNEDVDYINRVILGRSIPESAIPR